MSNATGKVITSDGTGVLGYFLYNGISDIARRSIWDSVDQAWDCSRLAAHAQRICTCGLPDCAVLLYTEYGSGFYWPSRACLACRAITGERDPWGEYLDRRTGAGGPESGCPLLLSAPEPDVVVPNGG